MQDDATVPVAVLVALGGAAGASLRYGLGLALAGLAGTLAANVLGSVALGALLAAGDRLAPRTRLALGGGLLSSFTTYSTFAVETLSVSPPVAVVYVVGSVALCVGAVLVADTLVDPGLSGDVPTDERETAESTAESDPAPAGGDRP